ncbi:hypothetical protein HYH02_005109 [Chlamydomonas schloesseri]|uniref:DNA 3'-5' helicase n=1 Tax=Chlamydomonas schloesseri TaxID=2026947 RepID=A0A835WLF2_9CHLO|nr:hypothetical protein HYH02_005109 [Chlamydomonas schloesseri]|eukprot:KAG2449576.1 hypothetical protein HYH02_005109 [Chlamydomonas schloesseri]
MCFGTIVKVSGQLQQGKRGQDRSTAGDGYATGYQSGGGGGSGRGDVGQHGSGAGDALDWRTSQGQAQGWAPPHHLQQGMQLGPRTHINPDGARHRPHLQQPPLRAPLIYQQQQHQDLGTPLQHQFHGHSEPSIGIGLADGQGGARGGGAGPPLSQSQHHLGLHRGSQADGGQRIHDGEAFAYPHMMSQQHMSQQQGLSQSQPQYSQLGTQRSDLLHYATQGAVLHTQEQPTIQPQALAQAQQQWLPPSQQQQHHMRQAPLSQVMPHFGQSQGAVPMGRFRASGGAGGMGDSGCGGSIDTARPHMPLAAPEPANTDRLVPVRDLPVALQPLFPSFRYFNSVQSECFPQAYGSDTNMVVSAPTGSGKTGVMELALLRLLSRFLEAGGERLRPLRGTAKAVYVAPLRALVQEKCKDWQARFGALLGLTVLELSGDTEPEASALESADLLCTTPEKLDALSRKLSEQHRSAAFLSDISLVLIDEVHLLNETERGSALEAGVVSRFAMLATFPQLQQHAVSKLRFVAVSATIPNVRDIATWLRVPPAGLKVYGEEMRPVKLRTVVLGYVPSKNDFLFERRLDTYLAGVVAEHSGGKPTLVFCSSRKGTVDSALHLAKEAGPGGRAPYVRDTAHAARLAAAARQVASNKQLQSCLLAGVGFHNAAMEGEQREVVERLFLAGDLPVLCSTSTLALGVNLPAHLVVIRGTRRYCGADGGGGPGEEAASSAGGYKEYDRSVCLQASAEGGRMVGRAGRPQFDTEGVAVIMTQKETRDRYTNLLSGSEAVESCLHQCFAEHLNAEIVLGTVRDMATATQWLRTTFLHVRVRQAPRAYGLDPPPGALSSDAAFDAWLAGRLVGGAVTRLAEIGLVSQDPPTGVLAALEPGRIMAHCYLRLGTMSAITQVGSHAGMMALLRVIAVAEEFAHIRLRRGEKKVLNDINKRVAGDAPIKFPVPADPPAGGVGSSAARPGPPKPKDRISKATEKIFIMVNEALSDTLNETLDYSMRQELDGVLRVGQRIAAAMIRYFTHRQSLAATANALCLAKSLKQRMWDDSKQVARQLPDIGRLLAHRLADSGVVCLRQLAGVDPRRIESITQKAYPFGNNVRMHLAKLLPPEVAITLRAALPGTQQKAGGGRQGIQVEVTLARSDGAAGPAGAVTAAAAPATRTSAVLLVGSSNDDRLLRHERLTIETFASPYTFQVMVNPSSGWAQPQHPREPLHLLAVLVVERLCGLDVHTSLKLALGFAGASVAGGAAAATELATADGLALAGGACGGGAYGDAALQPSPLPHGPGGNNGSVGADVADEGEAAEGGDGAQAMPSSSQQQAPRAGAAGRAAAQQGSQGRSGNPGGVGPTAARPQVLVQAPALAAPAFAQLGTSAATATTPPAQLHPAATPPGVSPAPQSLQGRGAPASTSKPAGAANRGVRGVVSASKASGGQATGTRGGSVGSRPGVGGLSMSGSALAGAKQVPAFARLLALAKSRSASSVGAALAGSGGGESEHEEESEEDEAEEQGQQPATAGHDGGSVVDTPWQAEETGPAGLGHRRVSEQAPLPLPPPPPPPQQQQQPTPQQQDQRLDLFDFLSGPPEEDHAAAAAVTPPPHIAFAAGSAAFSRLQPAAAPTGPHLAPTAMRANNMLLPARGGLSSRPVSMSSGTAAPHAGATAAPAPTPTSAAGAARPGGTPAGASDMLISDRKRAMLTGARDRATLDGLMLMQQRQRKAAANAVSVPNVSDAAAGSALKAGAPASACRLTPTAASAPPPSSTAPLTQAAPQAGGLTKQSDDLQNQVAAQQHRWGADDLVDEELVFGSSVGGGACWDQFVEQHDARPDVTWQRRQQQENGWGHPKLPRRSYGKIAVAGGSSMVGSGGAAGSTSSGATAATDYGGWTGPSFSLDKAPTRPPSAATDVGTGGATSVTGVSTLPARPTQRASALASFNMVGSAPSTTEVQAAAAPAPPGPMLPPPPRTQLHAHVPDSKPLAALTQGLRKRHRSVDVTPVQAADVPALGASADAHIGNQRPGGTAQAHFTNDTLDQDVDPTQDWFSQLQF